MIKKNQNEHTPYTYNLNIGTAHAVCTVSFGVRFINGIASYQNKDSVVPHVYLGFVVNFKEYMMTDQQDNKIW